MSSAASLYQSVIQDVMTNVRDAFLDEAIDESVLQVPETKPEFRFEIERESAVTVVTVFFFIFSLLLGDEHQLRGIYFVNSFCQQTRTN